MIVVVAAVVVAGAAAAAAVGGSELVLGGEVRPCVDGLCLTATGRRKEAIADAVASTCPSTNLFYLVK